MTWKARTVYEKLILSITRALVLHCQLQMKWRSVADLSCFRAGPFVMYLRVSIPKMEIKPNISVKTSTSVQDKAPVSVPTLERNQLSLSA